MLYISFCNQGAIFVEKLHLLTISICYCIYQTTSLFVNPHAYSEDDMWKSQPLTTL